MLLLDHTAANRNYHIRIFVMGFFQYANIAENALFCVFADGAGIENNKFRTLGSIGYGIAHLLKDSFKLFAVGKILLAAISMNKCIVRSGPLFQNGAHSTRIIKFRHRKFLYK